jgi:hypothetical protein
MSAIWTEALDAEDYEDIGETYDSEDIGESYDGDDIGEGDGEDLGEESRADRRRRERQRRIMLERQRQAQQRQARRPPPPARRAGVPQRPSAPQGPRPSAPGQRQTIRAIRSLDIETKVGQDSLRRALEESNRRASRATWAAVAGATVDQGLASFENDLANHPYVAAAARFAPLLLLSPEKKRGGFEGFVTDARVVGGAAIFGIAVLGQFRSRSEGVTSVVIVPSGTVNLTAGGAPSSLTAVVVGKNGPFPTGQYPVTWSSNSTVVTVDPTSGLCTPSETQTGPAVVTATAGSVSSYVAVVVSAA